MNRKQRLTTLGLLVCSVLLLTGVAVAKKQTSSKEHVKSRAAKTKMVDINSATKEELAALPGVGDELAEKIIAGRPYTSKRQLLTKKIVSRETYNKITKMVVAKRMKKGSANKGSY
jgi:competence protein ComEA